MNTQYTPSQLAEKLHISVPTLRKYSLLIEEAANDSNYFPRNHQNVRSYTEKDLQDIQELVDYSKQNGLTLQKAAAKIFSSADKTRGNNDSTSRSVDNNADLTAQLEKISAQLQQTQEQVATLTKRLDNIEATTAIVEVEADQTNQAPQVLKTISLAPKSATVKKSANQEKETATATTTTTDSGLNFTEPTVPTTANQTDEQTSRLVFKDEQEVNEQTEVAVDEATPTPVTETEVKAQDEVVAEPAEVEAETVTATTPETAEAAQDTTDEQAEAVETTEEEESEEPVLAEAEVTEPAEVQSSEMTNAEANHTEATEESATEENSDDTEVQAAATATTAVTTEEKPAKDEKKKSWWKKMLSK